MNKIDKKVQTLKCSFCDKIKEQVHELAYDNGTFICDECIVRMTMSEEIEINRIVEIK